MMRCVLGLALVLGVVACGDDDGSGGGAGTLDKRAYEQRYREVREGNEDDLSRLRQELTAARDPERLASALQEMARLMRTTAEELDALRPPDDIATEHQGYVDLLAQTADGYEEVAGEMEDAPSRGAALKELTRLREVFGSAGALRKAQSFTTAIREGGYDLGIGPGRSTLPGQSP